MVQEMMMLTELNQYMNACGIERSKLSSVDLELLSVFVESLFRKELKKDVRVKFKRRGTHDKMKYGCIYFVSNIGSKKDLILFQKDGLIKLSSSATEKEKNIANISFKKWCDVLQFENAGRNNNE